MITPPEEDFIKEQAYVPEHMPGYGTTMSGGEPFLLEDYLVYHGGGGLVFIGYPLKGVGAEKKMEEILEGAVRRFKPAYVALIAPHISRLAGERGKTDVYFKLDLASLKISSKVQNLIRRASRVLQLEKKQVFTAEHRNLIAEFLESHSVDEGIRSIFQKIPVYLSSVPTAWVFNARDFSGRLVAFAIAELGGKNWAFYLFNFRSRQHPIPGTSDFLLHALIQDAQEQGKKSINLGLGINSGVAFFKRKWGGQPFLKHEFVLYRPRRGSLLEALFQGLSKS